MTRVEFRHILTRFRAADGVPETWLPWAGIRDLQTGWYAIHRKVNGDYEACLAPGLWAPINLPEPAPIKDQA